MNKRIAGIAAGAVILGGSVLILDSEEEQTDDSESYSETSPLPSAPQSSITASPSPSSQDTPLHPESDPSKDVLTPAQRVAARTCFSSLLILTENFVIPAENALGPDPDCAGGGFYAALAAWKLNVIEKDRACRLVRAIEVHPGDRFQDLIVSTRQQILYLQEEASHCGALIYGVSPGH